MSLPLLFVSFTVTWLPLSDQVPDTGGTVPDAVAEKLVTPKSTDERNENGTSRHRTPPVAVANVGVKGYRVLDTAASPWRRCSGVTASEAPNGRHHPV